MINLDSSKQYIISNTKNIKNTTNKIIYICIIFFITIIIISIIFVSILINKNRKNLKK